MLQTCRLLQAHPELGEACDHIAAALRVFSYRGYGIYYRVDAANNMVRIARLLHASLDVQSQTFD